VIVARLMPRNVTRGWQVDLDKPDWAAAIQCPRRRGASLCGHRWWRSADCAGAGPLGW